MIIKTLLPAASYNVDLALHAGSRLSARKIYCITPMHTLRNNTTPHLHTAYSLQSASAWGDPHPLRQLINRSANKQSAMSTSCVHYKANNTDNL